MAHPQSTSHESLTIAINLRKAANRLPYMNAERMAAKVLKSMKLSKEAQLLRLACKKTM